MLGVDGGEKYVVIGDVVAATRIYGYESGKSSHGFKPRADVARCTHALVQRARAEVANRMWLERLTLAALDPRPRVHVAPIAAGEKVVASTRSPTFHFLQQNYSDAIAV